MKLSNVLKEIEYNTRYSEDEINQVLQLSGISVGSVLGRGSQGVVFDVGNQALKVTKDQQEYLAAQKLLNNNFSNVYKVYHTMPLSNGYFGIYQEKLRPITPTEDGFFYRLIRSPVVGVLDKAARGGVNGAVNRSVKRETQKVFNQESQFTEEDFQHGLNGVLQILQGIKELQSVGLLFKDVNQDNIMARINGQYVLIDIGAGGIK